MQLSKAIEGIVPIDIPLDLGIHISLAPFDCAGMSELKLLVSISCKSISSYVLYDIDAHHYDFSTLNYLIPKDVKA